MNTSYDNFVRTTDEDHETQVKKIFKKLYDKGDIYKGSYEGLYCTPCESCLLYTSSKPFGVMELISRVKALLRRTEKEDDGDTLACGSIEIDNKRHSVTVQGETCELTFKEFELLKYLMINQGIVLSRDKLMNQVWGFEYEGESRTVDMHIKTLRHKLGDGGQQIKTVRNVGYVMEP